jgi:hypothetical protein
MVKLIIGHHLYMKSSNWYGVCCFDTGNMIYMDLTRIIYRYSLGTMYIFTILFHVLSSTDRISLL